MIAVLPCTRGEGGAAKVAADPKVGKLENVRRTHICPHFLFRCFIRLRFLLGKYVTNKKMSIPRNATKKTGKGQNRSKISKTKIVLLFLFIILKAQSNTNNITQY